MTRLYQTVVILIVALGVTGGLTMRYRISNTSPSPPAIDPKNVDPAVVKAITECRQRVLESRRTASAWGNLGMVLSVHDFTDEADMCFREAERLDVADPRWPYFQGIALIKNDPAGALPKLRKAVELAGSMATPRLRLAKVLTELGQLEEAEPLLRTVLQAEPENPWAQLGLGRLFFERGQSKECLRTLEALANNPATRKAARTMRLSFLSQLDDKSAAKAEIAELGKLPDDLAFPDPWVRELNRSMVGMRAMLNQINHLLSSDRGNEAAQLLVQMVERYPQTEEAWRFAGQLLLKTNDMINAEAAWRHVLEHAPDSVVAHYSLGVALFRQGNYTKAAQSFTRATELKSDHGMAYYFFGKCLEQKNEYSRAIIAFRQAARCQPQTVEIHMALGDALEREGKLEDALAALKHALTLRPNDASLIMRIAKMRQPFGRLFYNGRTWTKTVTCPSISVRSIVPLASTGRV